MKIIYNGPNQLRRIINYAGATTFAIFCAGYTALNNAVFTGHPSADIVTGRSQPTAIEKIIIDSVK